MSPRDFVLILPQALGLCLLAEWLELSEIVDLDNAYCSKASRPKFLALLASPDITYTFDSWLTVKNIRYIEWLNRRSVHVFFIRLPRELVPDVVRYRDMCDQLFSRSGAALRKLEFVGNLIKKPEIWEDECEDEDLDDAEEEISGLGSIQFHDILPILRHCPNLTELMIPDQFHSSQPVMQDALVLCPHLSRVTFPSAALVAGLRNHASFDTDWSKPVVKCINLCTDDGDARLKAILSPAAATPPLDTLGFWPAPPAQSFRGSLTVWCQLRTLHLAHAALSDELVLSVLPLHPHLKCLYLQCGDNSITDVSLLCLAEHCCQLTDLHIRSCGITNAGVTAILQQCPLLHTLNLDYSAKVTDQTLSAIATYGKNLHTLSLDNCANLSEWGLSDIAKELTTLKYLKLSPGCVYWFSDLNAMQMLASNGCTVVCTEKSKVSLFADDFAGDFDDVDDLGF